MSICPHCGSNKVLLKKYKVEPEEGPHVRGSFGRKSKDLGTQDVGNCQDCGYTWIVAQSVPFAKRAWPIFLHGIWGCIIGLSILVAIAINFPSSTSEETPSNTSSVLSDGHAESIETTDSSVDDFESSSDKQPVSSDAVEEGKSEDVVLSDEEILVSNGLPEKYATAMLQVFDDLGLDVGIAKFSQAPDWYKGERYFLNYSWIIYDGKSYSDLLVYFLPDGSVQTVYTNGSGARNIIWGSYSEY